MKILSVDRLDAEFAFCEDDDGNMFAIAISEIPEKTKSGDILVISDSGDIYIDREKTMERKREIRALEDELWYD